MNKMILCVVMSIVLFTAVTSEGQWEDSAGDPNSRVFEGKVSSVDTGASTLTVDGGVSLTFNIPADARIMKDTSDIRLSDISVGDYVNVEYTKGPSGESKVFRINVLYKDSTY